MAGRDKDKNSRTLKYGIAMVFLANLLNLVIGLVNGFILPKLMSYDTYAGYKTYSLYISYVPVLALGYNTGLYLRYGGKEIESIDDRDIIIARSNMLIMQGIMTVIFVIIGILSSEETLTITSLAIVPVNIGWVYKNIFQATGEFKMYSSILNYTSVLQFIVVMVILLVFKSQAPSVYVTALVVIQWIIWGYIEYKIHQTYNAKLGFKLSWRDLKDNIKSGFVITLGDLAQILMLSIDRWFVKFLLAAKDFAFYSFTVGVESLVDMFVTPVSTTMYNYICVTKDFKKIRHIKEMCLLFVLLLISSAFAVKFILEVYLTNYYPVRYILFILFAGQVFFMVIKGIYVNVYKARDQQTQYFLQLVGVIGLGVILNIVFFHFMHSNEGIAIATLISAAVWYILCSISIRELRPDWKELLIIVICLSAFFVCGFKFKSIPGFIIYVAVWLITSVLIMRKSLADLLDIVISMIREKLHIDNRQKE